MNFDTNIVSENIKYCRYRVLFSVMRYCSLIEQNIQKCVLTSQQILAKIVLD